MIHESKTIGKYEIVALLGSGAMGTVYKGFDPIINRYVAIKILTRQGTEAERAELATRFKQEARAAGRLNHPGIVAIYDYGEDGDIAFIAMELVEGCTLAEQQVKRQIPLSLPEIWSLMIEVLDALGYAHSKGVVHRDIKSSNIMQTTSGKAKITDFGIARIDTSELTQVGTVIGTPGYMSPEQLMGQRVDHRSDIFSCGILFYQLLTGERAFAGTDIVSTIYKVVHTEPAPPSRICPTVPEAIDAVIARALAKNPEQRYYSAEEFAEAIRNVSPENPATSTTTPAAAPDPDKTIIAAGSSQSRTPEPHRIPLPGSKVQTPDSAHPGEVRWSGRKLTWISAGIAGLVLAPLLMLAWIRAPTTETGTEENPPASALQTPSASENAAAEPKKLVVPRPVTPNHQAGTRFSDCPNCPEMIIVPAGSFTQGSPPSEADRQANEGPQHTIHINYPLAIGMYEVTRQQFADFVSDTGYQIVGCNVYDGTWHTRNDRNWQSPGFHQSADEPVTCVSWVDARAYAKWLADKTGQPYRLLSASEWEYIARAGTQTARSWGDDAATACQVTNVADRSTEDEFPGWQIHQCTDSYIYTAPSVALKPNGFGVYSMLGNLFEWVEDCWNDDYNGSPADGSAELQGDCNARELRGGSWYSRPEYVRSAFRNHIDQATRASTFGIRVARELPPD